MVHVVPDCGFARSYIIETQEGIIVIDPGSIGTAEDLDMYIKKNGMALEDVKIIISTHFHIDHIGGIGSLLKKCLPETKVLFHRIAKEYLYGKRTLSSMKNWLIGFLPAVSASLRYVKRISHLNFEALSGIPVLGFRKIARMSYDINKIQFLEAVDRERYKIGYDDWEIIETPGHTEDSISLYSETSRELICGDMILNFQRSGRGRLNKFNFDGNIMKKSFQVLLNTIKPKIIYPGHGEVIRNGHNALFLVDR